MNTKHTPWPWEAKGIHVVMSDGFQFKQQTPIGEGACIQTQQRNQERREANARLIAGSPSLYDFALNRAEQGDAEALDLLISLNLYDHAEDA